MLNTLASNLLMLCVHLIVDITLFISQEYLLGLVRQYVVKKF